MAHLVDAGASSSAGAAQLFAAAALAQDHGETTDYSAISRLFFFNNSYSITRCPNPQENSLKPQQDQ